MNSRKRLFIALFVAFITFSELAVAQAPSGIPDISGSWERAREASIPAQGQPPLKPQFMKEWQVRQQAARDASAKGAPLRSVSFTVCLTVCPG